VSESTSTDAVSEPNSPAADAAASSSASEGASSGTQPAAVSTAAGTDADAEARARSWQSRADKAERERDQLKAQLDARATSTEPSQPATAGLSAADLHAALQVYSAAESVKSDFPEADSGLFSDLSQYGSVEALRAAAQRSHESRKAQKDAMRAEIEADIRSKYAEQYGELREEQPPSGGETPTGLPTIAQIRAMSLSEQTEFEKANPGVIRRVLAEQTPNALMGGLG